MSQFIRQLESRLLSALTQECLFRREKLEEKDLRNILDSQLRQSFGSAWDLVSKIEMTKVYKGVTYESLTNSDFVRLVREAMPDLKILHEEYDAARQADNRQMELEIGR